MVSLYTINKLVNPNKSQCCARLSPHARPASLPSLANLTTWQPGNLANLAPVPFFPDFSAWIPNFFAPTSGLKLDVLVNNNQSAR